MHSRLSYFSVKWVCAIAFAAALASCIALPSLAFASVKVDDTELAQGENAVGGGTATLSDSNLDMNGVTAGTFFTDEDLSVVFSGGNVIDEVNIAGAAVVDLSFTAQNEVEEVHASGTSNVTINANANNEFEEIEATEQSNLTVNITGETEFEEIVGRDDANVTVRGTDCQKRDIVNLGEDEDDTEISTERGTLVIDHVTVNLEGDKAFVGSTKGDVVIDTSKVAKGDDNEYAVIKAGGTMKVIESVIDITGTVYSIGKMTIEHSDVEVEKPDSEYGDDSPYRVYSETGIDLIAEKNGEVKDGEIEGKKVYYVDTDDDDDVDLEADGTPAYYRCKPVIAQTSDTNNSQMWLAALACASALAVGFAMRRRRADVRMGP